ncbi:hypothetical protein F0562_002294 [Nyssa sinensis]|uniref:DYW domain-containing protein n=1 Tax=Nyssa sinensis TaxID=561372 RepID=A0A5J5C997_9ASTE|nr:hypothetical protein F0562_002294 [Nyssa sinensis]
MLSACKDRATIAKVHAFMIISGVFGHGTSNGQLVASYARIGDIGLARRVFDKLPKRGIEVWNAMIIAYSRMDRPVEVISLFHQMNLEGARPDSSTFTVAIKACTSLLDLEMGEKIHSLAIERGYEYDVFVGSSVLNLYAKYGKMDEAMCVFDKMPRRDLVSWTTMITGFAQNGRASEAVDTYQRMRKERMEGDGVVMVGLIQACAKLGDTKMGLAVHGYMIRTGLPMDVVVQTSLVDMYAKSGHVELASRVFRKMSYRNVISWGVLISGYAQNGFAGNALELLVEMQRSIHGLVMRRLLDFDQVLGTAVIDMYSKCGALPTARALFDHISYRDSVSWNTMIASYGIHGHGKEALSLFLQMMETDLKPDHATFASLLSAFSHSGLVEEGQYWFNVMVNEFMIQPAEKHYACMVDLLARGGRVKEACEMIDSITIEPGLAVWVALLSGCHYHGKLLVGELVAKKVIELNPDDPGIYILVSNFFAAARKWDEVAGVRKVMRKTGMKKVPGYSVVEVNGKLHAFLMEDKSHPQYEQILEILGKLELEMRPRLLITKNLKSVETVMKQLSSSPELGMEREQCGM